MSVRSFVSKCYREQTAGQRSITFGICIRMLTIQLRLRIFSLIMNVLCIYIERQMFAYTLFLQLLHNGLNFRKTFLTFIYKKHYAIKRMRNRLLHQPLISSTKSLHLILRSNNIKRRLSWETENGRWSEKALWPNSELNLGLLLFPPAADARYDPRYDHRPWVSPVGVTRSIM